MVPLLLRFLLYNYEPEEARSFEGILNIHKHEQEKP